MEDRYRKIVDEAKAILWKNRKEGSVEWNGSGYSYVCPSIELYPFQWLWDSCFHAIVLTYFDINLAKQEIVNLLLTQHDDGFIPHTILWGNRESGPYWIFLQSKSPYHHSSYIQPPVMAQAVKAIFDRSGDIDFLKQILPNLRRYYLWLQNRDFDNDGLISIIAPWESGLDESPAYDLALGFPENPYWSARTLDLRYAEVKYEIKKIMDLDLFDVEDVLVNSIYAQGLKVLSELYGFIGNQEENVRFKSLANRVEKSIIDKCYIDGCFYNLVTKNNKEMPAMVLTVISLMPLILDNIERDKVDSLIMKHLLNPEEFWLPYPIPSVARSERSFDPIYKGQDWLWKGPTWINTNWFIVQGLLKHGYKEIACEVIRRTLELVSRSGFREFYNPWTGEGYGATDFGWSTLVVDLLNVLRVNGLEAMESQTDKFFEARIVEEGGVLHANL